MKPKRRSLARWIERNVVLPREVCADPGRMKLYPYMREIVAAIEDPTIERVTLLKPVRVGFSTLLHAITAYYIVEEPAPMLSVLPTDADCRRVMVSELERIFEASPKLAGKLPSPKLGDRTGKHRSTILHRLFEGGSLHMVAAKAPRNLRGPTARVLLIDEVDAMAPGDEGNPIDLAVDRTHSFADRKIIIGSTPGDEETSLILPLYGQSDMRVYELPCPSCGTFGELLWQHIEWQPDKPWTAAFRCAACGDLVPEENKIAMVKNGRWRATASPGNGHAGFRLNSLVSTLVNASWGRLAADFLLKKDDPERLRTFVNRFLGQGWRDEENQIDDAELAARAEAFGLDNVPAENVIVTAGVDVQDDRLEVTLVGWTRAGDALVLAHLVIWGSPEDNETWRQLDELLKTQWKHPHGGTLRVDATCVDSGDGDWTDRVYAFCFPRAGRRVMAVKGMFGSRPSIQVSKGKVKGGGRLWVIGTDTVKTTIMSRLSRGKSIRFSRDLEAVYYEQLASEKKVVRYSRGRPVKRFERVVGRRAEALDCLVYAFAARAAVSIPLDQRESDLRSLTPLPPPNSPTIIRSQWMAR